MRYKIVALAAVAAIALAGNVALAAPFKAEGNPQIVANYPTGPHGIPGESEYHEGADVVMRAGNSGNFQQWFYGTSASEGLHGEHSLWKYSESGECNDNEVKVEVGDPSAWGDYLVDGGTYCVKTNDFHPSK